MYRHLPFTRRRSIGLHKGGVSVCEIGREVNRISALYYNFEAYTLYFKVKHVASREHLPEDKKYRKK